MHETGKQVGRPSEVNVDDGKSEGYRGHEEAHSHLSVVRQDDVKRIKVSCCQPVRTLTRMGEQGSELASALLLRKSQSKEKQENSVPMAVDLKPVFTLVSVFPHAQVRTMTRTGSVMLTIGRCGRAVQETLGKGSARQRDYVGLAGTQENSLIPCTCCSSPEFPLLASLWFPSSSCYRHLCCCTCSPEFLLVVVLFIPLLDLILSPSPCCAS